MNGKQVVFNFDRIATYIFFCNLHLTWQCMMLRTDQNIDYSGLKMLENAFADILRNCT
jgi:hypothetical protein